jgi:glycosyltransferase A (GT-A) superfamily protein (DUF2064 family)
MDSEGTENATLVVFCRRPAPGVGKQRIAAALGQDLALTLADHLLACALEDAASWPGAVVLAPACAEDRDWAAGLLGCGPRVLPQDDGNLGERLSRVDRELRAAGVARLIYIGSDAPLHDCAFYARARTALEHADAVLGPAEDGGVTLMGARVPWPGIADLPWSTPGLGAALDRRCRSHGMKVQALTSQYDIDEADALPRLYRDLGRDPRPARTALRQWLHGQGLAETRSGVGHR